MKKLNVIGLLIGLVIATYSFAVNPLPTHAAVPGGIIVLPLEANAKDVSFKGQRVMVISRPQGSYAIVGLPLTTKPGEQQLTYREADGELQQLTFTVYDKIYPKQYLTIANKRKVNPNPIDLKRIAREQVVINKIKDTWTSMTPHLQFGWPVKGRISSEFGLQRYYNGQPRSPHNGLDIAAPQGTPIKAPAAGRIIGTGNFFYSGNTVYVDHGEGLITVYGHMSKIKVKTGQEVKSGTVLGLVGKTGRATGPHLHWSAVLNKALVDPRLLLQTTKN